MRYFNTCVVREIPRDNCSTDVTFVCSINTVLETDGNCRFQGWKLPGYAVSLLEDMLHSQRYSTTVHAEQNPVG